MSKLGYTWYPKDWGNSDSVFELSLCERGLYREFIDFAMLNDNKTELKKDVWVRKFSVSMNELNLILDKLLQLNLIEINENILFIPSCENRLNLSRGGKKGKPTKETILNLKHQNKKPISEPISEPMSEPISEQREIESEIEREREREIETKIENKVNINSIQSYFKELPTSSNFELIAIALNIPKDKLTLKIADFKKTSKIDYLNFNEFCNHFKNWANKNNSSNLKLKTSFK
jgi:hypothetical protein